MKLRRNALLLATALAGAGCAAAPAEATTARVYSLRYASPYASTHPFSRADLEWMKHVHAVSAGRLRIEPFWAGALLSSEQSMLELRHGVADVGVITPIYARGGAHALRTQAAFYSGARAIAMQVAVYRQLAREFPVLARELAGLRVLAVQGGNLPGLLTRNKPVHALSELASLRLRVPAELTSVMEALGADPVSMPMGDVYSAMSKGIIDGVLAPADALRSMHLAEVGRYYTALAVPRGAYPARAISERAWRRLPAELQGLLADSSTVWEAALERQLKLAEERGTAFAHERHLRWIAVAPAEQRRFEALYNVHARRGARQLQRFGVQGEPMFERAQALIRQLRAGVAEE